MGLRGKGEEGVGIRALKLEEIMELPVRLRDIREVIAG